MKYDFIYDEQKNLKLMKERGVGFEDVIDAIKNDKILEIIPHPNRKEYPNQKIMILEIKNYVYLAPYLEEEDRIILKTVFPSRKFAKVYLGGKKL